MNIQWKKILLLMDFLFLSIASGCFLLTNFTITLVLESLLYLETSKQWHPSMSFGSISKSELWQMSNTTFFRLSSDISFGIPDNSKLLSYVLLGLGLTFFKAEDSLFQFCIYIFHNCQTASYFFLC